MAATETPAQAAERRAADAERKRAQRARQGEEAAAARREENALLMRHARQVQSPEQVEARLAQDAEQHARARADATPEEAEARRVEDAERRARARLEATPEQVAARRDDDAARHARVRERQGPEAADERRAADAERHASARLLQTPEDEDARRALQAAHMADVREVQTPQRAVQDRVQRQLRDLHPRPRVLNLDIPEDVAPAAAPAAPQRAPAAAGQPTLKELFDATMAAQSLNGLTYIEQQLIARVHPVVSVYKVRGGQYGYSGNIINFPQDVQELATALPHRLADLNSITTGAEGHVDFNVRAGRVRAALVWLKEHQRYYRDVEISEENLSQLPANAGLGNPREDAEAVGIHVTCMPMIRPELNEDQVESHVTDWPTIGPQPVNEFTTDDGLPLSLPNGKEWLHH
ncbi:hypothetical protein FOCC_FOCC002084 [Frankliniella occidentalis]|nr:hypothetical protein FOCC_FOCC002084 [Frankliniella occidentalis]